MTLDQLGAADLGRLVHVELRGVPLPLYARARQHSEEMQREFALIRLSQDVGEDSVPNRLLELVNELSGRFSAFADPSSADLEGAVRRGETHADVVFTVPEQAAPAAESLRGLLDEADDFCRNGDLLLTLAAPDEVVAFRHWFLGEFVRQIAGEPPNPWPGAATG